MNFRCQVNHALDNEHRATLDLLGRVEQAFVRAPRSPVAHDPELSRLAASLASHIEQDVGRHFEFEERDLFPRLEAAGEGDIVGLLMEEHHAIREVAAELLPLARAAAARALEGSESDALRRAILEIAERLAAHIQKETVSLMPVLDDLLDDATDREIALVHATA
jgi:hemerythrin-like domain-containing protein